MVNDDTPQVTMDENYQNHTGIVGNKDIKKFKGWRPPSKHQLYLPELRFKCNDTINEEGKEEIWFSTTEVITPTCIARLIYSPIHQPKAYMTTKEIITFLLDAPQAIENPKDGKIIPGIHRKDLFKRLHEKELNVGTARVRILPRLRAIGLIDYLGPGKANIYMTLSSRFYHYMNNFRRGIGMLWTSHKYPIDIEK